MEALKGYVQSLTLFRFTQQAILSFFKFPRTQCQKPLVEGLRGAMSDGEVRLSCK